MTQVMSTICSSIDIMLVVITHITIMKEKIKESEQLEESSSSFNSPIGDPMCNSVLELASIMKCRDLFQSCNV